MTMAETTRSSANSILETSTTTSESLLTNGIQGLAGNAVVVRTSLHAVNWDNRRVKASTVVIGLSTECSYPACSAQVWHGDRAKQEDSPGFSTWHACDVRTCPAPHSNRARAPPRPSAHCDVYRPPSHPRNGRQPKAQHAIGRPALHAHDVRTRDTLVQEVTTAGPPYFLVGS